MNAYLLSIILFLYGSFLIICGIMSVIFIGMRAKTALISGGTAGGTALLISYLSLQGNCYAAIAGIVLALALFVVFSWRSTKTLFSVFEMIQQKHEDLKGKGIAFLIISLMAVVSLVVLGAQIVLYLSCCGTGSSCTV